MPGGQSSSFQLDGADARSRAAASITRARFELDRALAEIDTIQVLDPGLVGLVAHAMDNYITVTAAAVEMLQLVLRDHEDRDVGIWLTGIGHATDLMQHSVGRLVSLSPPRDFKMTLECVNLPVLMERACEYHRRHRTGENVRIVCRSVGTLPLAWGDRVAIAVIAENLLANAVRATLPCGVVDVAIKREPGHVRVTVRDSGRGLTPEEQKHIFRMPSADTPDDASSRPRDLGMVIAHEFAARMDGELWCESEPGRGASFSFRLPAVELDGGTGDGTRQQ